MDNRFITPFTEASFHTLPEQKKFKAINLALHDLINRSPPYSFLLKEVISFIAHINDLKVLNSVYDINQFEFWLIHFSSLSFEDIRRIRGKITGKYLPRDSFQLFFPIGTNKIFRGSHFVVAHLSPDVDTTIASFVSWLEAFSAPVGASLQIWNVPNTLPSSPVMGILKDKLGDEVFQVLMKNKNSLSLTAQDLITQEGFIKSPGSVMISNLDHGLSDKAIILTDNEGNYIGDWRSSDVEMVRQVIVIFKSALRNFENQFLIGLTRVLSKEAFNQNDIQKYLDDTFMSPVGREDLSELESHWLDLTLKDVVGSKKGILTPFQEMFEKLGYPTLTNLLSETKTVLNGFLKEIKTLSRPDLFKALEKLIQELNQGMHQARDWIETLAQAIKIKEKVFGSRTHTLSLTSDLDEIQLKMKHYEYLTVVVESEKGLFPVGIVRAKDIRLNPLGTVSLRDFSNFDEVKMPPYLSVISVIDHHKSDFRTSEPSVSLLGDTQSCNVLIAEVLFKLNDNVSTRGLTDEKIDQSLKAIKPDTLSNLYRIQTLIRGKTALNSRRDFYIHPEREMLDYTLCLYAILDDTDLLTKVTPRDVFCVKELINRIVSLEQGEVVDLIDLNDIPLDDEFAHKAASRILQTPEMYRLYHRLLSLMEQEIDAVLTEAETGKWDKLFSDTKEQNGIAQITQIKLFQENFSHFDRIETKVRSAFVDRSLSKNQENTSIDLFIFMLSTIPSAEELGGAESNKSHKDEIWFWISEKGEGHLSSFLNGFMYAVKDIDFELILINDQDQKLKRTFQENAKPIKTLNIEEHAIHGSIACLRYNPGLINSRKTMISPYLPKL